jgi:hypothetical protein
VVATARSAYSGAAAVSSTFDPLTSDPVAKRLGSQARRPTRSNQGVVSEIQRRNAVDVATR